MAVKKSTKKGKKSEKVITKRFVKITTEDRNGSQSVQEVEKGTTIRDILPTGTVAYVNNLQVSLDYVLAGDDYVRFLVPSGKAGSR